MIGKIEERQKIDGKEIKKRTKERKWKKKKQNNEMIKVRYVERKKEQYWKKLSKNDSCKKNPRK